MKPLDKYRRSENPIEDRITTTVSISKDQKRWLDSLGLNLSEMVRDMIDEALKQFEENRKAKK